MTSVLVEASPPGGGQHQRGAVDETDVALALESGNARLVIAAAARRYGAGLGKCCMAMVGSRAVADELVQETFLTAFSSLGAWRKESTLRAWLFGIARKKCLKHVETHRRQAQKLHLVRVEEPGDGATTEELLSLRLEAERARAALSTVPPTEREALVLRFAGELGFDELAAAAGIEEAAARKRVSRGIARLREIFEETKER